MNDLLELKGQFQHSKAQQPGAPELPRGQRVTAEKLRSLAADLMRIRDYWEEQDVSFDPLVSAHYRTVVAKSNRIRRILGSDGNASGHIVGARFEGEGAETHHVITYYVAADVLDESIDVLATCANVVDDRFAGAIDDEGLRRVNAGGLREDVGIKKSAFAQIIRDAHYVTRFDVKTAAREIDDWAVVSIYDVGYSDVRSFLAGLGLTLMPDRVLGNTVRLNTEEYAKLVSRYPYLVSMAVSDISRLTQDDFDIEGPEVASIPDPGDEPIVGVIDTPFDDRVYFADWVEDHNLIPEEVGTEYGDMAHGTAVTSIIVDGPSIEPDLDDGCGRFRVRHFGVAKGGRSSSFGFMRQVKDIVEQNRDIKVWNISQGSMLEIERNSVSPEGAMLDDLQARFDDIVFVVAGTNQTADRHQVKIGAPADSINSLVVNATGFSGRTASYSRRGPVLDFFKKPDVCAVGGDRDRAMHLCVGTGETFKSGTSFAAPWVARKMAYLMQVMGLPREVAKALIVDSAAGWDYEADRYRGYGQVPRRIEDVVEAQNDEIRFFLTGTADEFLTYNYGIPVPIAKDKHPYVARATLCYFPNCDRRQGVDYTSTEMDLHFGRIDNRGKLKSLDNNRQGEEGYTTTEEVARKNYRKWDNVKHIGEAFTNSIRERKTYDTGMWGIKIRTTECGDKKLGRGMRFGAVITLKEINGVNRIDDFIQRCALRGWIVNRVDIQNRVDIYNAAEVEVDFDE